MRAIVHIGLPKTGTSTFQGALHEHIDELRRHGVRVLTYDGPDEQFAPSTRAFDLANCVVRGDLDVWWRTYLPESALPAFMERGRTSIRQQVQMPEELIVATVEDLFLIRTDVEVKHLVDLLAPREVSIVLTIRNREDWIRSLRAQLIVAGIRPFSHWEESCSNLSPNSWLCDIDGLISLLSANLGASRVTMIDYDSEMEKHGSVLPALWRACNLPAELLVEEALNGETWRNPRKHWANAADPPPGTVNEVEWLRLRVLEQARELERHRRAVARFGWLARPIERLLSGSAKSSASTRSPHKK